MNTSRRSARCVSTWKRSAPPRRSPPALRDRGPGLDEALDVVPDDERKVGDLGDAGDLPRLPYVLAFEGLAHLLGEIAALHVEPIALRCRCKFDLAASSAVEQLRPRARAAPARGRGSRGQRSRRSSLARLWSSRPRSESVATARQRSPLAPWPGADIGHSVPTRPTRPRAWLPSTRSPASIGQRAGTRFGY